MKILALVLVMAVAAFAMTDAAPDAGIAQPETDTWLEEIAYWSVEEAIPNAYSVGCGWDGTHFWISNGAGQAGAGTGMFYLFDHAGAVVDSFPQNDAPGWGLRDLCCDGTYMYGSVSTAIDYYDITTYEKVGAFTGPISPNRALAWDGTHFYTSSFSTDVNQLTWDGVSGSTAASTIWSTAATSAYGAAWDYLGDCLWVTSANGTGIVDQIAADGSLIEHHTLIPAASLGGATMSLETPINELYVFEQGSPDAMHGYDVNPSALERDTWGSIKSLF
ncbi:MAG: hypothetical protein U9P42_01225 [Candidatus Fermentibacteria bacterium]|nr:hypothetical protein [Candidatus Fermentibacteria bacterium]